MSKDWSVHPKDETVWKIIILEVLLRVGLSLGISSIFGSKYPNTTNLAFALWVRLDGLLVEAASG